jgi:hypothetical protein
MGCHQVQFWLPLCKHTVLRERAYCVVCSAGDWLNVKGICWLELL